MARKQRRKTKLKEIEKTSNSNKNNNRNILGTPLHRVVVQRQTLIFIFMTAAAWSVCRPPSKILFPSIRSFFFSFFPAPYLTKTEQRIQVVCCSCTVALSQTGRLIGTEWRVLARSLHAGVTLWEEEEEERLEGRGKSGCLGFYLTSQLLMS